MYRALSLILESEAFEKDLKLSIILILNLNKFVF